jgi:hypothetical protein
LLRTLCFDLLCDLQTREVKKVKTLHPNRPSI